MEDINDIGRFINAIFSKVCAEVAAKVATIPEEYKLWNAITLLFWNVTSISTTHTDPRDFTWSMVLPFGQFSGGDIDLSYLNATAIVNRRDVYFIHSKKVFHNLLASVGNRQALVFTNHQSVISRFCNL